jgi:hypothetical protein
MLAMNMSAMKATRQLDDLGQNRRLDNITRALPSNEKLNHYIDELSVLGPAPTPRIGWQEE